MLIHAIYIHTFVSDKGSYTESVSLYLSIKYMQLIHTFCTRGFAHSKFYPGFNVLSKIGEGPDIELS